MTRTKNIGTKKIARTVADNIPPITHDASERLPLAPAPVATINGSIPNTIVRIHTCNLVAKLLVLFE